MSTAIDAPPRRVVLDVRDLVVTHTTNRGERVYAVSGVSLQLYAGETLGVVGESGCGKSSLARAIMQLPPPTEGSVQVGGTELVGLSRRALRTARRHMQLVFQDPIASLNPRRPAHEIVAEPLRVAHGRAAATRERIREVLDDVGLDPDQVWDRRAAQMSGGQCQRLSIGRALAATPTVLVCDEPVSALDVSIQAHILNLLEDTKERHELSLIFIAHDLAVINNVSDRIMVMYLGRVCEIAPSTPLTQQPAHPYTRLLLESVPEATGTRSEALAAAAAVEPPSPLAPPSGCRFRTRCPLADAACEIQPDLTEIAPGHFVACHHNLWENGERLATMYSGQGIE